MIAKKPEAKKNPRMELLFVGKCTTMDGKRGWEMAEVDAKGERGKSRIWGKAKGARMPTVPGGVYSVEYDPSSDAAKTGGLSVYPATWRYEREWGSETERLEMQAAAQAEEDALNAKKEEKEREEAGDELSKLLDKLASAYAKMPLSRRAAFLARINYHVMRRGELP